MMLSLYYQIILPAAFSKKWKSYVYEFYVGNNSSMQNFNADELNLDPQILG